MLSNVFCCYFYHDHFTRMLLWLLRGRSMWGGMMSWKILKRKKREDRDRNGSRRSTRHRVRQSDPEEEEEYTLECDWMLFFNSDVKQTFQMSTSLNQYLLKLILTCLNSERKVSHSFVLCCCLKNSNKKKNMLHWLGSR